jgi:hypothetical protein
MLSRSSSFRTSLGRYPVKGTADRGIIERWQRRGEVEGIWAAISATEGFTVPPSEFIAIVLQARRRAQSSVNQMYGAPNIKGGWPERFPGVQEHWTFLKEKLAAKVTRENIATLEAALDLHHDWFDESEYEMSAKDHDGTRVQRLFWKILGDYLLTKFGRSFDKEVAILTEIAFALPIGSVSPSQIADARKPRSH